jgi:3D (Asp-Asp-Asp) domain-containing protein
VTVAARLAVLLLAALAVVRRGERRPGDLLRHAPAVVVGVAPPPPPATPKPFRVPAPKLFRALAERARDGEQIAVNVTAYCLKGTTRRGNYVRAGIIAADPRVFPLARHVDLFIGRRYFGRFLVDDTGKDIKGNRLDLWTESCGDARYFGRRYGTATLVQRDDAIPREPDVGPRLR